jgi:hypothetical protein
MTSVAEALAQKPTQLAQSLADGVKTISYDEEITFRLYERWIHPLDGMAYWLRVTPQSASARTQLLPALASATEIDGECVQVMPGLDEAPAGGMIVNPLSPVDQGFERWETPESIFVSVVGACAAAVGRDTVEVQPGQAFMAPSSAAGVWVNAKTGGHRFTAIMAETVAGPGEALAVVTVKGSLHYSTQVEQLEDVVAETNTVIFTALEEVKPFNQIGADQLYIGSFENIRFSFSSRGPFYEQADLYHYVGQALYSVNAPMIVDLPSEWAPPFTVSDSLPLWLAMNSYVPPYAKGLTCPVRLYPSFLITDNLPPPFGAVHVEETNPFSTPWFDPTMGQDQPCADTVRVTLYGCDHETAQRFLAFVMRYSQDWSRIGIMVPLPVIRTEKAPQPEFKILAPKKTIAFAVSYRQAVARDEARQLIYAAYVEQISGLPKPYPPVLGRETGGLIVTELGGPISLEAT